MTKFEWELESERLVQQFLGRGVVTERDPGGGPESVHDFVLTLDSDRRYAFEVTRHMHGPTEATRNEIARRDWRFDVLTHDWFVGTQPAFHVPYLHAQLPGLLVNVESAGVEDWSARDDDTALEPAVATALASHGVRMLKRWDLASDPRGGLALINQGGDGGSTAPSVLVEVAHHLATRKAGQLEAAVADEKHVFVWVDRSMGAASAVFAFGDLPSDPPPMPEIVDAVWLADAVEGGQAWRYGRTEGWVDLGRAEYPCE